MSFGKSNLKVSRLCLGAMGFGAKSWRDWVLEADEAAPVIDRALSHGINFFDTCDFYSAGESERILGQTVLKHHPRDSVVIATKAGNPMAGHPNGRGFSRKHLFKAIDDLAAAAGNGPRRPVPDPHLAPRYRYRRTRRRDGGYRARRKGALCRRGHHARLGLHPVPRNGAAAQLAGLSFDAMRTEPGAPRMRTRIAPLRPARGAGHHPLQPDGARLPVRRPARPRPRATARTKSDDYTTKHYYRAADFAVQQALAEIAAERRATASQIALAWTLQRPGVTAPIFGATSQAQVDEAVAAMDITLSNDEIARIDETYAPRPLSGGGH
ncbi:MAG: aldo/keto reductase [Roseovarius pacificus]|nr:aldo/keto reductase [Roseovarius pacificus]